MNTYNKVVCFKILDLKRNRRIIHFVCVVPADDTITL